jgi:hypothetical protein
MTVASHDLDGAGGEPVAVLFADALVIGRAPDVRGLYTFGVLGST